MTRSFDLDRYLAMIHSSPAEVLAQLLDAILQEPEAHLEHLKVFVPEVSQIVGRLVMTGDPEAALQLANALEEALEKHGGENVYGPIPSSTLDSNDGQTFVYHLGRLREVVILAKRLPVFHTPLPIVQGVHDCGETQGILEILAEEGPLAITGLRNAFRNRNSEGGLPSLESLHRRLLWLVRQGVLNSHSRGEPVSFTLSPLGRRLIDDRPIWLDAVARAYRSYRKHEGTHLGPFCKQLFAIFQAVDRELEVRTSD